MRWYLLALIAALVIADQCRCQEKDSADHAAQKTNSLSSLEALLVGTWRWDVPAKEETNVFLEIHLSADKSWSISSDRPPALADDQSGTWFVHERILVLRIANTKTKYWEKMAWPFDIKSATPKTLVLTNSPLGDVTWTRIAQRNGAANRSQPVRPETNRTSATAGSGR
jgi:hypothetical protein